jgi:hypothetical protein
MALKVVQAQLSNALPYIGYTLILLNTYNTLVQWMMQRSSVILLSEKSLAGEVLGSIRMSAPHLQVHEILILPHNDFGGPQSKIIAVLLVIESVSIAR